MVVRKYVCEIIFGISVAVQGLIYEGMGTIF